MVKLAILAASILATVNASFVNVGVNKMHAPSHVRKSPVTSFRPQSSIINVPTEGNIWPVAIFWIEIEVGTPPVKTAVAVDSGSMTLNIQGVGCDNCPKTAPNNVYSARDSSSSSLAFPFSFSNTYQTCDLSNPVAPCTIKGRNYYDTVSIGGLPGVKAKVGAITEMTSNFDQFNKICGVIGFAGGYSKDSVFESMRKENVIEDDIFSMCLRPGVKSNGTLTLGGIDDNLKTGDMLYSKNTFGKDSLYAMNLLDVTVSYNNLVMSSGISTSRAILDSGTNVLLMPTGNYNSFRTTLEAFCEVDQFPQARGLCQGKSLFDGECYDFSAEELEHFPTMYLQIGDEGSEPFSLKMSPSNYLKKGTIEFPDKYCLGVRDTGATGFFIIGDNTMEDYYVAFDRAEDRIGWAPVNAENCGSY